jgi:hypothetical protein
MFETVVSIHGLVTIDGVPPTERACGAGSGGVFPFRFSGESIFSLAQTVEAFYKFHAVEP